MKEHSRKHRMHKCVLCGYITSTSSNLLKHMKNYHKDNVFECKDCDKWFSNEDDLKVHDETNHKKVCVWGYWEQLNFKITNKLFRVSNFNVLYFSAMRKWRPTLRTQHKAMPNRTEFSSSFGHKYFQTIFTALMDHVTSKALFWFECNSYYTNSGWNYVFVTLVFLFFASSFCFVSCTWMCVDGNHICTVSSFYLSTLSG